MVFYSTLKISKNFLISQIIIGNYLLMLWKIFEVLFSTGRGRISEDIF
jgi:hypothetical protein